MLNLRTYGIPPYRVVVIHGGPGAAGEMAPVARELARDMGVLEPLQTAISLDGQVDELKTVLENKAYTPVTLIGFSWGAWLSFIVATRYPSLVGKLILVGCGGFAEKYGIRTHETRLNRLNQEERIEFESLIGILKDPDDKEKDISLARLGALVSKTDTYDPLISDPDESEPEMVNGDIFQSVWNEAEELRRSGKLLEFAYRIECPVVAIHGDYDPHPVEGVELPLSAILKDFRLILLPNCGHTPWIEKHAKEEFVRLLKTEIEVKTL